MNGKKANDKNQWLFEFAAPPHPPGFFCSPHCMPENFRIHAIHSARSGVDGGGDNGGARQLDVEKGKPIWKLPFFAQYVYEHISTFTIKTTRIKQTSLLYNIYHIPIHTSTNREKSIVLNIISQHNQMQTTTPTTTT